MKKKRLSIQMLFFYCNLSDGSAVMLKRSYIKNEYLDALGLSLSVLRFLVANRLIIMSFIEEIRPIPTS